MPSLRGGVWLACLLLLAVPAAGKLGQFVQGPLADPSPDARVEVEVVDAAGRPLAAQVSLATYVDPRRMPDLDGGPFDGIQVQATAADGVVRLAAYAGRAWLEVAAPGHTAVHQEVQVEDGADWKVALLAVPERTIDMRIEVVDAETGRPIPSAYARIEYPAHGLCEGDDCVVPADGDGIVAVMARPAYAWIEVGAPRDCATGDCRSYHSWMTSARLDGDRWQVRLEPVGAGSITGVVKDAAGRAVTGAAIFAMASSSATAETDAKGSFAMAVEPGHHTVTVQADGFHAWRGTHGPGSGPLAVVLERVHDPFACCAPPGTQASARESPMPWAALPILAALALFGRRR